MARVARPAATAARGVAGAAPKVGRGVFRIGSCVLDKISGFLDFFVGATPKKPPTEKEIAAEKAEEKNHAKEMKQAADAYMEQQVKRMMEAASYKKGYSKGKTFDRGGRGGIERER